MKSKEYCLAAIRQNRYAITFVPEEFVDEKLYLTAVHSDGRALPFVPANRRTRALGSLAMKNHVGAILHLPTEPIEGDVEALARFIEGSDSFLERRFKQR